MPRHLKTTLLVVVLLTSCGSARPQEEPRWRELREKMVRQTIAGPTDGRPPVRDARVLAAMRSIPRHEFVPADERSHAYEDHPLRIGYGQTISQPYIVAIMTELATLKPEHRVLEVGTGSGYQAAVLSPLVKEVYTIEIVKPLGESARERLARLGYKNVEVRVGDGYNGWPEKAPFDAIVVTAGAPHVPPALVEQLKPGGRMVIPLGESSWDQNLVVVHKGKGPREFRTETIMPVRFVPLTREPATKK
jgi:protein-L-isoaspartate(D-aspartate) O-methyltransferase